MQKPENILQAAPHLQSSRGGSGAALPKVSDLCSLLCSQPRCLSRHCPANSTWRELTRPAQEAQSQLRAESSTAHPAQSQALLASPLRENWQVHSVWSQLRSLQASYNLFTSCDGEEAAARAGTPACLTVYWLHTWLKVLKGVER